MLTRVSTLTAFVLAFGASGTRLRRRHTTPASSDTAAGCSELREENNGTHYTVLVQVGTPGQSFRVVADTGS